MLITYRHRLQRKQRSSLLLFNCCLANGAENTISLLFTGLCLATAAVQSPSNGPECHKIIMPTPQSCISGYTRSGRYVSRLIFNFEQGDVATLLLGMLGDARRQSSQIEDLNMLRLIIYKTLAIANEPGQLSH
jgi:hypothetical protein